MIKQHLLRAAAIFFAAAAILTLTGCGDQSTGADETQAPTSAVSSRSSATEVVLPTSAADSTDKTSQTESSSNSSGYVSGGSDNIYRENADPGDTAENLGSSSDVGSESSSSSGASSKNGSTAASSAAPSPTVVIDSVDREIVIEQGENELPFVAN